MIPWKPASQKPINNTVIWVLTMHPKGLIPLSCAIYSGTVNYNPVNEDDWIVQQFDEMGAGALTFSPPSMNEDDHDDVIAAWCYFGECEMLPAFLPDILFNTGSSKDPQA